MHYYIYLSDLIIRETSNPKQDHSQGINFLHGIRTNNYLVSSNLYYKLKYHYDKQSNFKNFI